MLPFYLIMAQAPLLMHLYKVKYNSDNTIQKYKVRLVDTKGRGGLHRNIFYGGENGYRSDYSMHCRS